MSKTQFRIGDRIVNPTKGKGVVVGYDKRDGDLFVIWDDVGWNNHYGGHRVVNEDRVPITITKDGSWSVPSETKLDKESKVLEILRTWHSTRKERI